MICSTAEQQSLLTAGVALWTDIEVQNDVAGIVRVGLYAASGLREPSDTDPVGDDAFEVSDELVPNPAPRGLPRPLTLSESAWVSGPVHLPARSLSGG